MKFLTILSIISTILAIKVEPTMETIKKMQKSTFGQTIINTIALELQNKDSADDLIQSLRQQEDNLQEKQDKDDDEVLLKQNQCVTDLQKLVDEIDASEKRVQEIEAELKVKIPLRDQKVEEQKDQENFRTMLLDKLEELELQKGIKIDEYKEEQEQHDQAAYVFQSAKQALSESIKQSFLQKSSVQPQILVQVSNKLYQAKKLSFKRKSWSHLFQVLSTITSKQHANEGAVAKVIELIEKILEKVAESREIERKDYEAFINEYSKTKMGLTKRKDTVQAAIDQLIIQIETLNKRIQLLNEEQKDQEERKQNKTEEHGELEISCDDEAKSYSQRRQARSDQLEIVSDAIALLTSQIRLLKKFISQRLQ